MGDRQATLLSPFLCELRGGDLQRPERDARQAGQVDVQEVPTVPSAATVVVVVVVVGGLIAAPRVGGLIAAPSVGTVSTSTGNNGSEACRW